MANPTPETRILKGLTERQMDALGEMPLPLGRDGCLPVWGPSGQTIRQLAGRELIELRGNQWVRTPLGDRVREAGS